MQKAKVLVYTSGMGIQKDGSVPGCIRQNVRELSLGGRWEGDVRNGGRG